MREVNNWRKKLTQELKNHWDDDIKLRPSRLCLIELGLYLLHQLAPQAPAHSLWVLLMGYDFPAPESRHWTQTERQMLANARHLLTYYRGKYPWLQTLKQYNSLPERLRGYDLDATLTHITQRDVTVASKRFDKYAAILQSPLPYQTIKSKWVTDPADYFFDGSHYRGHVNLPINLILPPPQGHNLQGKTTRPPIEVSLSELLDTARWMDTTSQQRGLSAAWESRLQRVKLELFNANKILTQSDTLTLEGMMHLIGMVSSGKSTLMDVLAVWAARNNLRITLIVGSVVEALNRAKIFHELGLTVAPILGSSNRERHTNRLHRLLASENPTDSPMQHQHVGFNWLSTACPLDGLRQHDEPKPLELRAYPCNKLYTPDSEGQRTDHFCPIYKACPFHQAQNDLVSAAIWITTSYGLVYRQVDKQLNPENVHFAEIVYRCSDIVIVDEADQVQVQLDNMFSPNQTLIGEGQQNWLGGLFEHVTTQMNRGGRQWLEDENIDAWCQVLFTAQTATNRIYGILLREELIYKWVRQDYFTDWLLVSWLCEELGWKAKKGSAIESSLPKVFDDYLDNNDALGEQSEHSLSLIARELITSTNNDQHIQTIIKWLQEQADFPEVKNFTPAKLEEVAKKTEFALLVGILQNRLHYLIQNWKQVEEALKLDGNSSMMFHRPPRDYEAYIPTSPMGNILAFRYLRGDNNRAAGHLHFFRCMGLGRSFLLHFHEFLQADQIVGPHVLLMSGTSWAGTSPSYHIQVPVSGILRAPDEEIKAIAESSFEFKPFYDADGKAMRVSGIKSGHARIMALENLLHKLAAKKGVNQPSFLEQEQQRLEAKRQRILLVVGSYDEAKAAKLYLERLRPEWAGQVLNLVADDDEFESDYQGNETSLQRGLVHQLAQTEAWILIAPLLAIERGHNILNDDNQAALGAAFLLVRPHPRPDDMSFAIQSINRWAIEHSTNEAWLREVCSPHALTLDKAGDGFSTKAFRNWRWLLQLPLVYRTLPDNERQAVTWSQLVSIWQVIGRLVRGGCKARVYFCDAAFETNVAHQTEETEPSLLLEFSQILKPYFEKTSHPDHLLVKALYEPFYNALQQMRGISHE